MPESPPSTSHFRELIKKNVLQGRIAHRKGKNRRSPREITGLEEVGEMER